MDKAKIQEFIRELSKPLQWCFLKSIKTFVKLADQCSRTFRTTSTLLLAVKTRGETHINFFIQITMQKRIVHIHLMEEPLFYNCQTIPAGWATMLVNSALQVNPNTFKDPLVFNPWRWKVCSCNLIRRNKWSNQLLETFFPNIIVVHYGHSPWQHIL